jgi:hypothetical protein
MYIPLLITSYFGLWSYVMGIARSCGFGNTKTGRQLGFYPSTPSVKYRS